MRLRTRLLLPVLLLGAVLSMLLITPSGTTWGTWRSTDQFALDQIRNGQLELSLEATQVGPLPGSSSLLASTDSEWTHGALSVSGEATVPSNPPGPAIHLEYLSGDDPAVDLPLTAGQDLPLTLTLAVDGMRDLYLHYAGYSVDVTTTATLVADRAPNWSAEAQVTTAHPVDFPRPTHPGGGGLDLGDVCRPGVLDGAVISWAWPDSSTSSVIESPAVHGWTIEFWDQGSWQTLFWVPGNQRSAEVSPGGLISLLETFTVRVVGHSKEGEIIAPATFEVDLRNTVILFLEVVICSRARSV